MSVPALQSQVRRGLAWSTVSNLVLRLGSLSVGIILARLLTPEQFGIFAVALTVQTVLVTLADLGLSADLIRVEDPQRRAPTIATLGLVAGGLLTAVMVLTGQFTADLLGSPEAGGVITVLAFTLVLSGAGVVPYAMLQRRFEQKKIFAISVVDFVLGTGITLALVVAGWGVMALAVSRICAQVSTTVLQFVLSKVRPRFGIDRSLLGPVLRFGLPVAGANMLSWALLSIDNVVIARLAGAGALGFYVLAFNISNWPISAIGQVIRSVSLPAFARSAGTQEDTSLPTALALTWAVGLPAGALLAVLSVPLVEFVYGAKWFPAAPVLAALGLFGSLRLLFDVVAAYLLARGRSGAVLWVQVLWFAALVPAMVAATGNFGIVGGGWAHLAVGLGIVAPAYLLVLHRIGLSPAGLLRALWLPTAAMVPAWFAAHFASEAGSSPLASLFFGGLAGAGAYGLLVSFWLKGILRGVRPGTLPAGSVPAAPDLPERKR